MASSAVYSQDTFESTFETISISNLDRLEPIASWGPDGQLLSGSMHITLAKEANIGLIENRFENRLGTINLDQQILGSVYHFDTDMPINRTAISPNGQFAAVQDYTSFEVWNTATGKTLLSRDVAESDAEINDLIFSSKSDHFAYIIGGYPNLSPDDGIYIYDLSTGEQIEKLEHPTAQKTVFSHDGDHLVTAGYDGSLRLWDLRTDQFQEIRQADKRSIFQLTFVNSDILAVGLSDTTSNTNMLEYWNIKEKRAFGIPDLGQNTLYLKDGVASIALNHYFDFQLWSIDTGKDLATIENEGFQELSVEQNLLITSALSESESSSIINFHELGTGKLLYTINKLNFSSALLSSDGKKLILWNQDGNIEIWAVRKQ